MYNAQILADSISPDGVRITTFATQWPHAVHKDFMTHRVFSRNFESFRAQPPEQVIGQIRENPFIPEAFAQRAKGMGEGNAIQPQAAAAIRERWERHVDDACSFASDLVAGQGLAKQQVNFLLQDFASISGIVTSTEWENFFALRTELDDDGKPVARPEVYKVAKLMKDAYEASTPVKLSYGQWHLPLITETELTALCEIRDCGPSEYLTVQENMWARVSAGRCAAWSYGRRAEGESPEAGLDRAQRLQDGGHMSPFEHQARPFSKEEMNLALSVRQIENDQVDPYFLLAMRMESVFCGNLRGWFQFRKAIPYESDYGTARAAAEAERIYNEDEHGFFAAGRRGEAANASQ